MSSIEPAVVIAKQLIDQVLDIEEALNEGGVDQARDSLISLREQLLFLVSEHYGKSRTMTPLDTGDKYIH